MIKGFHRKVEAIQQQGLLPAKEKQKVRLAERKNASTSHANIQGFDFFILPGVYQTSIDTELMATVASAHPRDSVLEIGCGCGAVSILISKKCRSVLGADINPRAVENSNINKNRLGIQNASFIESDVFREVDGRFNVVICNPPYNNNEISDAVDRMFWDPEDEMKRRFFKEVKNHIKANGRVYFGWADFADLDGTLPIHLAQAAGLRYMRHYVRPASSGLQRFYVIEFRA